MKPSDQILKKAKDRGSGFDFITIRDAGISNIVIEILAYLDEQEENK